MSQFNTRFVLALIGLLAFAQNSTAQIDPPGKGYKPIVLDPSYDHTKWGIEPVDIEYQFAAFTTSFDSDDDNDGDGDSDVWGIPEWVAFEIKGIHEKAKGGKRPSPWLTDSALVRKGIAPTDAAYYVDGVTKMREVSGQYRFIRGHMCPKEAADRISQDAGYNTCTVLNAVPQLQWQNNGIWAQLEDDCLDWADKYKRIWVITGPVFFGKNPAVWLGQDGEKQIAVPDAIYKIVIREADTESGIETLAFLFPNIVPKAIDDLNEFISTVGRIEEVTGLQFLSALPGDKRKTELNVSGALGEWD